MASKPQGVIIPKKFLKNMWTHNPHGLGFVISQNERLYMQKGFRNFKDFWRVYREVQECPAVIHMRWANRGKVTKENDHPFIVDEDLAFAHNGTVAIELEEDHSDTKMLCEKVLKPLKSRDANFLQKDYNIWLLSKSIAHSKLAFIDRFGKLDIINKEKGEECDGVWYSNTDYKTFVKTKTLETIVGFHGNRHNQQASFHDKYEGY